jgi:hypothetical protein
MALTPRAARRADPHEMREAAGAVPDPHVFPMTGLGGLSAC